MTDRVSLFRVMLTIREAELALARLFADGEVPGFIHLSVGQEGVAAGVCAALDAQDSLASTHRGHGHAIARGIALDGFFAEVMGKASGICRGRGGSMHVADLARGMLGANGIVGAGAPIALGAALAHRVAGDAGVAVAFFGDGALAEGAMHETMNCAALWRLPLLLVCENNGWAEFSRTDTQVAARLSALAAAFGIPHREVDGNDVFAVSAAAAGAVEGLRRGEGPFLLEARTRRWRGHYEGDPQRYRDPAEAAEAAGHDPIARARSILLAEGRPEAELEAIEAAVREAVLAAVAAGRAAPEAAWEDARDAAYAAAEA
ncbi:thiamine pyrophosphate-dependent dehydrogenase E1 component subunit alpha [Roseomonas chloroacetimidivorans]|jgi:pyruvate dehydrogenase E1 component alpha subunit|uniref:thiamine pyrophosphate-dependent dehydrogenase E1 component subunit alpha n=1 Tax=Roseomonas chloroacetimidivorans TaxID=1766656 RepID=UPI003C75665D